MKFFANLISDRPVLAMSLFVCAIVGALNVPLSDPPPPPRNPWAPDPPATGAPARDDSDGEDEARPTLLPATRERLGEIVSATETRIGHLFDEAPQAPARSEAAASPRPAPPPPLAPSLVTPPAPSLTTPAPLPVPPGGGS